MDSSQLTFKQRFSRYIKKVLRSYRGIPDKKVYLEFLTGLLSIPVLLTVILLNLSNLKGQKDTTQPTPAPQEKIIYVSPQESKSTAETPKPTDSPECKKGIGPISISAPGEGDTVTDNPVNVLIDYQQGNYCSVVWAYRINGGAWSDYDDKSIALYNLPQGSITLDLKVKSIVTADEKQLTRTFTYKGTSVSLSPSPVASSSAQ